MEKNFTNTSIYPPNYYPEMSAQENKEGFDVSKLLSFMSKGSSIGDILSMLGANNQQMAQIFGLMNGLQKMNQPKTKIAATKIDCDYVLVKDFYKKD